MSIADRNKLIKQRLVKVFGAKNVSVRGERGTAYGWVSIKVQLDRPEGCTCNWVTETRTWSGKEHTYTYRAPMNDLVHRYDNMCPTCLELHEKMVQKVRETIFTKDIEYTHYTSDDGYGTEHAEVLYDVEIR